MSRKTRMQRLRAPQGFSLAHHSDYAATSTHFPKAFSYLGKDISFSDRPFYQLQNHKLTFVGSPQQLQQRLSAETIDEACLKQVCISLKGTKTQNASQTTNWLCFGVSLCVCCLHTLTNTDCYRQRFYPKYSFRGYELVLKIIRRFSNVDTLIINFQDNQFSRETAIKLDRALHASSIKNIVLRNMAYFMTVPALGDFFGDIRHKPKTSFKFIWQGFKLFSHDASMFPESKRLLLPQEKYY